MKDTKKTQRHMICNAHIDPIWQWDWPEGASATLSTFYSAAKLCDECEFRAKLKSPFYSINFVKSGSRRLTDEVF